MRPFQLGRECRGAAEGPRSWESLFSLPIGLAREQRRLAVA
jgi:hypothetical protein